MDVTINNAPTGFVGQSRGSSVRAPVQEHPTPAFISVASGLPQPAQPIVAGASTENVTGQLSVGGGLRRPLQNREGTVLGEMDVTINNAPTGFVAVASKCCASEAASRTRRNSAGRNGCHHQQHTHNNCWSARHRQHQNPRAEAANSSIYQYNLRAPKTTPTNCRRCFNRKCYWSIVCKWWASEAASKTRR